MNVKNISWRRWFGLFFLFIAGGMVVWGITLLAPFLERHRIIFVAYWMTCFGMTGLAMLTALIDAWLIRREARADQIELFRSTFKGSVDVEPREKNPE